MNDNDIGTKVHSKKIMASYSLGHLIFHLVDMVIVSILFFFYEAEVGLDSWLTALGIVIYAVWDAFNDPLVGYITDRPFKFTRKWGRRYPWMMVSYLPWMISFLLIFTPPDVNNQWILFAWLAGTLCLYDSLESLFLVNAASLFPDKFRQHSERLNASAFTVYIGFVGVFLGFLLPPTLIIYGNIGSYALMAWACVLVGFICWIPMIPGIKDDKENVERFLAKYDEKERESFFNVLKQTLNQKSFVIFIIMYILYLSLTHLMSSSLLYYVRYILKEETSMLVLLTLLLLIGGLISMPIWLKLNGKLGDNRKTIVIAGYTMVAFALPFSLITDPTLALIFIFLLGFGIGGHWVMIAPIFSDIIDESIVDSEKRREGIYGGIRAFFGRAAVAIQAVTLAIVHDLTGYVEGAATQTPLAEFGIHLHMGLLPAIFMAIGISIFWKYFDITPEKAKKLKERIMELQL